MEFWAALLIFFASHSLIVRTGLRPFLVKLLGEKGYLLAYAAISVLLLGWLIAAAVQAPRIPLWPFIYGTYWIPNIAMPPALILLCAGFIVSNPLSIAPRQKGFAPEKPPFFIAITRHPALWGFFLWSASHIPPNGEYPLAIMFGLFAVFSLLGIKLVDRKRIREYGQEIWENLSRNTPAIPFASASFWKGCWIFTRRDLYAMIAGLISWAALYHLHGLILGIAPIPPLP